MSNNRLTFYAIVCALIGAGILIVVMLFFSNGVFNLKPATTPEIPTAVTDNTKNVKETIVAKKTVVPRIDSLLSSANTARGRKLFKKCSVCHTSNKGGKSKVGPNLWDVVGRTIASVNEYTYSSALRGTNGIWDYDSLSQFIYKPKTYIPGTKMTYAGLKSSKDRADIILYIRTLSSKPHPLP